MNVNTNSDLDIATTDSPHAQSPRRRGPLRERSGPADRRTDFRIRISTALRHARSMAMPIFAPRIANAYKIQTPISGKRLHRAPGAFRPDVDAFELTARRT